MAEHQVDEGRCGGLEWAVCASLYPGQRRSGDAFLVQGTQSGVLVAVVDGLGHGEEAADVAQLALASLRKTAGQSLVGCIRACHEALHGSRGAAITLGALDPRRGLMTWLAVGNVDAAVVMRRNHRGGTTRRCSVPLRGGVVGDRLPPLSEATVRLAAGDTLVAATDGVGPAFLDDVDLSLPPPVLSRRLHKSHARSDDDALVLVARWSARSDDR